MTRFGCRCFVFVYHSDYLNGEAAIRYVLAAELDINIVIPRVVQSIQYVKEAILLDNINVHNFTVGMENIQIFCQYQPIYAASRCCSYTDLPSLLVILQVTAPSPASRASTFRCD